MEVARAIRFSGLGARSRFLGLYIMGIETPTTLPDGEIPLCLKNMLVKLERIFPRFGVKNKITLLRVIPTMTCWVEVVR